MRQSALFVIGRLLGCSQLKLYPLIQTITIASMLVMTSMLHAAETKPTEIKPTPLVAELIALTSEDSASKPSVLSDDATVTLFNRDIVTFRAPLFGISPEKRAKRAENLIKEHLRESGEHKISALPNALGTIVSIGGEMVFAVTHDDVDKLQQTSLQDTVKASVLALDALIIDSRESRDVKSLTQALIKTSIATLVFVTLLWLLTRAKRVFAGWVLMYLQTKKLNLGGVEYLLRNSMVIITKYLVLLFYLLLMSFFTYKWLSFVLGQFPQSRAWGEQLNTYLLGVVAQIGSAILHVIPDLFIAIIIFMIARFVVQGLKKFFDSVALGRTKVDWMEPDVASTTRRIISVVVWVFAFTMAYPYLPGSETAAFKGISVLLGLMLSLGASSLVSQAGSGLILTYTRIYRRGEYVSVGEHEGTVTEMGLFTTRIRTGMGVELALPNSFVLSNVTKNYSRTVRGIGFVVDVTVTIGYDTPWRQVHAMLIEAATRTHGVLAEPAPRVFQVALSDFYPEYRLVCQAVFTEPRPRAEVMNAIHANIQDVFNEYGVQIMSPHYFADPAESKTVAKDKWYSAPAKPPK